MHERGGFMKNAFLLVLIGLSLFNVREVKSEKYDLTSAGTLSQKVEAVKLASITELKIGGPMGAADFKYIRDVAGELNTLDLQDAVLENGLLPEMACYGMTNLSSLFLPLIGVKEIGDNAFAGTSVKGELSLPFGLERIGVGAFAGCSRLVGTLDIPSSVITLEDAPNHKGAFYGCSGLEALVIPVDSKMTHIGAGSFNGCSGLKSVQLSKNIKSIGGGAFAGCKGWNEGSADLTHVRSIGGYQQGVAETFGAFEGCEALGGVQIDPNVLVQIGNRAFKGCSSLKGSVSIHSTVLDESFEIFDGTQMDVQPLVSSYIRPKGGAVGGDGASWGNAYTDFGKAAAIREGRDDRYFFLEGNHVAERQYIESEYVALLGGYAGTERWGEECRGGESRLSLAPSDSGDVIVFDYNWDVPLRIDLQNIAIDGFSIVKQAEGNWQGAKITNASFYSPISVEGDITFKGKLNLDGTFIPTGRVTMDKVTFSPYTWEEYDPVTGLFIGLSLSDLSIIDSFVVDFPTFIPGERTILTTKGSSCPPVDYFRHTVGGRPLTPSEQVRFTWEKSEEGLNKLQMISESPLSISLTGSRAPVLSFGESLQLGAVFSEESRERETSWVSSRTDIVTVDATGNLTAADVPSDATITVSAPILPGEQPISSACRVYVAQVRFKAANPRTVPILSNSRFRTDVLPANLPDARLVWSVSDPSMATIDSVSGLLTAGSRVGSLTVTARLRANDKVFATYEVYIVPASFSLFPLFPDGDLERGRNYGFTLLFEPHVDNEVEVEFSVSDSTVVKVVGDSICAVGQGTAVVRVRVPQGPDGDALFDSVIVKVSNPTTRIETPSSLSVGLGDTFDIPVTLFPEDASESKLNWISKNPSIVDVPQDGRFKALALGTALLIVSTPAGLSDTCEVKVCASVVRINVRSLHLRKSSSYPLAVSFVPESAHDDIVWSTSDPTVVVVDENGVVTACGIGNAQVTVSTGARVDTCMVTSSEILSELSFYLIDSYKEMSPSEVFTLALVNATGFGVTWKSTEPSVATVVNGTVTALRLGATSIQAISSDGTYRTAQCVVSVKEAITSVEFPRAEAKGIDYRSGTLFAKGLAGHSVFVTSLSGQTKAAFTLFSDDEAHRLDLPSGVYLIHSTNGVRQSVYKVVIR
jgi:uncharacterized protein YjdB